MVKTTNFIIVLLLIFIFVMSPYTFAQGTIKSVKIGRTIWMAENLNVTHFRNGDVIPEAKSDEEWLKAAKQGKPVWCYPRFNSEYASQGKLYNGFAVSDKRELAPRGWHLPTIGDVDQLNIDIHMDSNRLLVKGVGNGTNTSGFSAMKVPNCNISLFDCLDENLRFWMSYQQEYKSVFAFTLDLNKPVVEPGYGTTGFGYGSTQKGYGFPVRCVKD